MGIKSSFGAKDGALALGVGIISYMEMEQGVAVMMVGYGGAAAGERRGIMGDGAMVFSEFYIGIAKLKRLYIVWCEGVNWLV